MKMISVFRKRKLNAVLCGVFLGPTASAFQFSGKFLAPRGNFREHHRQTRTNEKQLVNVMIPACGKNTNSCAQSRDSEDAGAAENTTDVNNENATDAIAMTNTAEEFRPSSSKDLMGLEMAQDGLTTERPEIRLDASGSDSDQSDGPIREDAKQLVNVMRPVIGERTEFRAPSREREKNAEAKITPDVDRETATERKTEKTREPESPDRAHGKQLVNEAGPLIWEINTGLTSGTENEEVGVAENVSVIEGENATDALTMNTTKDELRAIPYVRQLEPVMAQDGMTYERSQMEEAARNSFSQTEEQTRGHADQLVNVMGPVTENVAFIGDPVRGRQGLDEEERRSNTGLSEMADAMSASNIANEFLCPISSVLPLDPVTAEDGITYERSVIEQVIQDQGQSLRSPVTNEKMGAKLIPAVETRNAIEYLVRSGVISGEGARRWMSWINDEQVTRETKVNAANGDTQAMCSLGNWYLYGQRCLERDTSRGFSWFKKAADDGCVKGMTAAAICLLTGDGTEANEAEGMALLGAAAQAGSGLAAYWLGVCYKDGTCGLAKNHRRAKIWFQKLQSLLVDEKQETGFVGISFSHVEDLLIDLDDEDLRNY